MTATRVSPAKFPLEFRLASGRSLIDSARRRDLLFEPGGNRARDFWGDRFLLRAARTPGPHRSSPARDVVDAGRCTTSTGPAFLRARASSAELIGVMRRDLGVEIPLNDQERLLELAHAPRGSNRASSGTRASPPASATLPALFPAGAADRGALNLLLQRDPRAFRPAAGSCDRALGRCCSRISSAPVCCWRKSARPRRSSSPAPPPASRCCRPRCGRPPRSAENRRRRASQPFDDADRVVGELPLRRRFGAAAALSDAALVVAEDEIALLGERAGELAEDRDAGDRAVAIDLP